jgi:hypothetical protein
VHRRGEMGRWTTTTPSGPMAAGGGCAGPRTLDWLLLEGVFVGNLDTMEVELHVAARADEARLPGPMKMDYNFYPSYSCGELRCVRPRLIGRTGTATVHVEPGATPLTERLRLRIEGIGLLKEEGDGTIPRYFILELMPQLGLRTWLWGATDVPAGITFNGSRP